MLRDLFIKDLGWKLFSLLLAMFIWLTVHKIIEEPKVADASSASSSVTYSSQPVLVVATAEDVHLYRVVPNTVSVTVSGRKGSAPTAASKTFHYELAQGGSDSQVRIVLVDKYGERELFNGQRSPGSKIDVPVQTAGGARVKIYINGILVEEQDL